MAHRVQFDFEIDFTNGGGIQGQDFRLDIAGEDISDRELADYFVADMRLLMVGAVRILNKRILAEPHKRKPIDDTDAEAEFVDLSHTIEHGLVTYKGLPAPIICDYLSREASREIYAPGTEFQVGKIEMVTNTGTYLDCPFHRYADGKDLSQVAIEATTDIDAIVVRAPHTRPKRRSPPSSERWRPPSGEHEGTAQRAFGLPGGVHPQLVARGEQRGARAHGDRRELRVARAAGLGQCAGISFPREFFQLAEKRGEDVGVVSGG